MKLEDLLGVLNEIAPLELSKIYVEKFDLYDNSGIIVKSTDNVKRVMFSLDLTKVVVEQAIKYKCDTIVTHHPAIYRPISSLEINSPTEALLLAVKNQINVVSFHLNLDIATDGIDDKLAEGLLANGKKALTEVTAESGYGKLFEIEETPLKQYTKVIEENFRTKKLLVYGDKNATVKKVASFCGAGSGDALKCTEADTLVTSDVPHHAIVSVLERKQNLIVIPHYVAENYGFKCFYDQITERLLDEVETYYVEDYRFM